MMEQKNGNKILIVYGSNYGSTADIAKRIGEKLREKNFQIEILNVNKQKWKNRLNLEQYEGYMLGSGIYIGSWTPKMRKFIKNNSQLLNQKTLAAFGVCGEVHNPERKEIAQSNYVEKNLKKWGIKHDFGAIFAGVLDLSQNSPYNRLALKVVRKINEGDPMVSSFARNDYRDWDEVEKFAKEFAHLFQFITETKNSSTIKKN